MRIFLAVLRAAPLRAGLRAELGALYPLLLLRPLEAERPDTPTQALMALEGLAAVCASPQVCACGGGGGWRALAGSMLHRIPPFHTLPPGSFAPGLSFLSSAFLSSAM